MKKLIFSLLVASAATNIWAQDPLLFEKPAFEEGIDSRIPLIEEPAPSFVAQSTEGEIKFPDDYGKHWKILFSHPQDFTPVCTTELLELAGVQDKFDKLDVKIIAISTDPLSTHEQWKIAMEELSVKNKKPVKINFPLVEDESLSVSRKYGMIHSETNSPKNVRGVFVIDPDNIIQAIYFYPNAVGRNTDELLRMVTALEKTRSENVMTPANWEAGDDVLVRTIPKTGATEEELASQGLYALDWFLWYKKSN
jgi:peroxiredoxin (alkyl hydroperoxide reductase subunit C)